jgi:hypothetical protein
MRPPAPNFVDIASRPDVTEASLRDFLAKPHGRTRGVRATPASLMSGDQADAVIAYLMRLRGKK